MLSRTGYAGHPALWYLVLAPFASAGLPYLAQQAVNLVVVWFAMALFLAKAPFRPVVKALFLFSFYPLAEYAIDARPYGLLIALLFAIAATWEVRHEHPLRLGVLTALLANTTAHGLVIAAVLGALFLVEAFGRGHIRRPPVISSLLVMLAAGIASTLQVWPPVDGQKMTEYVDPGTVPYAIGYGFLPGVDPKFSFAAGLLVILLAVLAVGDRVYALLFMAFSLTAVLFIFVFVWVSGTWHTGLILMIVLASVWMAGGESENRRTAWRLFEGALALCLAWGVYQGVKEGIADTKYAYSGSREMAEYIAKHVPDGTVIAAHPPGDCSTVLAYLPGRNLWFPAEQRYGSYGTWDRAFQRARGVQLGTARKMAPPQLNGRPWLLLTNNELTTEDVRSGFRLLHLNQRLVYARQSERFWLYAPPNENHTR